MRKEILTMTTIDDILNSNDKTAVKAITKNEDSAQQLVQQPNNTTKKPPETYTELLEELNPKPNKDKLKKDAKRARTRNIIAALGDGISALSNLYYTTKGAPNMLDGKNTLSEKSQARYDKLMQDYKDNLEKYRQGRFKAEQLDKEWDYRTERDKVGDEQWDKSHQLGLDKFEYQKERDKIGDNRYTAEQEHRAEREANADEQWNKSFNFQKQTHQDNKDLREKQIDAQNKRIESYNSRYNAQKRGKKLGFSDGNNSKINIYENVWKTSYPVVFEQLVKEGIGKNERMLYSTYSMMMNKYTPKQKMEFVSQNWHKSETAKNMMMEFSKIDPAVDESEIDIENYIPSYNDSEQDTSPTSNNSDDDYTFTFDNNNNLDW